MRAPIWSDFPCAYEREAIAAIANEPRIWSEFSEECFVCVTRGDKRLSAKGMMETVRGRLKVEIDNSITAYVARAYARANPHHAHLFEFRGKAVSLAQVA